MTYSPIEQGRLLNNRTLQEIAHERGVTAAQVAIAYRDSKQASFFWQA